MKVMNLILLALLAMLSGCELFTETQEGEKITPADPGGIAACGDMTVEEKAKADALVAEATARGIASLEDIVEELDDGEWDKAKKLGPSEALAHYEEALTIAPNHCEARFGRAIASLGMVIEDSQLDAFIQHMDTIIPGEGEGITGNTSISMGKIMTSKPDKTPGMLMKMAAAMNKEDPLTVKEIQELVEKTLLHKVEATIADLSAIEGEENFAFEFTVDKGTRDEITIQLDQGEIGPILAAAKVAKAFLLVVLAHNIEPIEMGGSMDWVKDLDEIEDFDNLTATQVKALDHITGLAGVESEFLSLRPEWKEKYQGIPKLLLEAVEHLQNGLKYGLKEAEKGTVGQEKDPYIVGKGVDADVDPQNFENAIKDLERVKKYLKGEPVTVKYAKGAKELRLVIPKFFEMNGYQKYLPYFKFYPYSEWNDAVTAQREWHSDLGHESLREIMTHLDYDPRGYLPWGVIGIYESYFRPGMEEMLQNYVKTYGIDTATARNIANGELKGYSFFFRDSLRKNVLAASILHPPNSCTFKYIRFYDVKSDLSTGQYEYTQNKSEGSFELKNCRVENGAVEFVSWVDEWEKGPIYFTDKEGKKTFEPETDGENINNPIDLKGKIILRDPTFNGMFPDLTNDNIWEVIDDVADNPPRLTRTCYDWWRKDPADRDTEKTVTEDEYYDGDYWDCDIHRPGAGASDLDFLYYWIEMAD